jgi:hypothetical protein
MSNRLTRLIQRTARPVARQVAMATTGGASGPVAITDVTGLTAALEAKADDSHTHLAENISDLDDVLNAYVTAAGLSELVDDRVGALLVAGTNITLTYNDGAGTLTIAASGGGSGLTHPQVLARGLGC